MLYICSKFKQDKMKKIILLLAVAISIVSCSTEKETTAKVPGMMELDLTAQGFPILITVPDSSKGKVEIVQQSWGATEIKVGKGFQISISEGEGDIALIKSDIASNDVNKFKNYVVDEPNALLYESEITQPEFHFYAIVKAGNTSYVVEDIKGEIFSKQQAETMLNSAKSIKSKEGEPAS